MGDPQVWPACPLCPCSQAANFHHQSLALRKYGVQNKRMQNHRGLYRDRMVNHHKIAVFTATVRYMLGMCRHCLGASNSP